MNNRFKKISSEMLVIPMLDERTDNFLNKLGEVLPEDFSVTDELIFKVVSFFSFKEEMKDFYIGQFEGLEIALKKEKTNMKIFLRRKDWKDDTHEMLSIDISDISVAISSCIERVFNLKSHSYFHAVFNNRIEYGPSYGYIYGGGSKEFGLTYGVKEGKLNKEFNMGRKCSDIEDLLLEAKKILEEDPAKWEKVMVALWSYSKLYKKSIGEFKQRNRSLIYSSRNEFEIISRDTRPDLVEEIKPFPV
ncbi:MAG: hypothetical protein N4A44_00010 [Alphaproteobacteria bacterium]|jgi:hypothetical protein|nr:hypothetical protein [Alphaproteobacteria bacterium]